MSSEARVQASMSIRIGATDYQARPTSFQADVSAEGGPTPGQITASLAGTIVDLSELTSVGLMAGLCRIMCLENANDNAFVQVGTFEVASGDFTPLLEILQGESFAIRLSRFLGQELGTASGTASSGADIDLMVKAVGSPCKVLVEAFAR